MTTKTKTIREYPQRARGPRALTADRFGQVFVGARLSPASCKWSGTAFAWQLVSTGLYRAWIPGCGWCEPTTRDEAQERVYCYNHDC